ncbi:MAG: hypothetical protein U5N55_02150 [Cypionkella sp.]|nr:hypothetical protein [Cypionkella sp.]
MAIEPTRALVVVNMAAIHPRRRPKGVNIAAARALPRQLRPRGQASGDDFAYTKRDRAVLTV